MSDHPTERPNKSLVDQIDAVLTGHPEREVLPALLQTLLQVIGVTSDDRANAEAFIGSIPDNLIPLLRANWPSYQAHRAKVTARQDALATAVRRFNTWTPDPVDGD